jgi:hypothetical protein
MIKKLVLGFIATFLLISCTDTAAIYREAMELKKLKPSISRSERDDISGKSGPFDITYIFYQDENGDPRRALVMFDQGDTTLINDHFYTNEKPLYYTQTELISGDTISSCTYFFHHGKCIKRACAYGDYEEEKTVEMDMEFMLTTMKDFTP